MNKIINKLNLSAVVISMVLTAGVANADTVTNNAAVTIIEPLTVKANDDMDFGKVTKPSTTGTVVLSSAGLITTTTGGITSVGGLPAAGTVDISGDSIQTVSVTVTDTTTEAGLKLSSFTGTFGGQAISGGAISGATLTGGTDVMSLGATLTIDSTAAGFTTGPKVPTYDVEVLYN